MAPFFFGKCEGHIQITEICSCIVTVRFPTLNYVSVSEPSTRYYRDVELIQGQLKFKDRWIL
jgi:hypothetical protein